MTQVRIERNKQERGTLLGVGKDGELEQRETVAPPPKKESEKRGRSGGKTKHWAPDRSTTTYVDNFFSTIIRQ